ncbi:MAG: 3'-5' exoribonuclease [Bdellovibrionaceae bacterium]|nr:3'-5' exoribonuclease [Pseudobdellovibrionaceae bacterium]
MSLATPWKDVTFVAFDTETSGAFPVGFEIVEMGAVKWKNGQILDRFQALIKPSVPMGEEVIKIHGITNEMVADAPPLSEVLPKFMEFLGDAVIIAHHAPFDLGFLVYDLERAGLKVPTTPALCSSLLARRMITESENHRLQTLVKVLNLGENTAHRALDDAESCQRLSEIIFARVGADATLAEITNKMAKRVVWSDYTLLNSGQENLKTLVEAVRSKKDVDFVYGGGSNKGLTRRMTPIGVVRNPDGDFVQAICHIDRASKRFYVGRMTDLQIVY